MFQRMLVLRILWFILLNFKVSIYTARFEIDAITVCTFVEVSVIHFNWRFDCRSNCYFGTDERNRDDTLDITRGERDKIVGSNKRAKMLI